MSQPTAETLFQVDGSPAVNTGLPFEVRPGVLCLTRGGWVALIVWRSGRRHPDGNPFYAIHHPGTPLESGPVFHYGNGRVQGMAQACDVEPPCYYGHPADILALWEPPDGSSR